LRIVRAVEEYWQLQRRSVAVREVGALPPGIGSRNSLIPKTPRSRRRIALSARAITALQAHAERQRAERAAGGSAWEDLGLVFPNTVGKPLDGTNLLKYW
jgi:hypothetical protein